MQQGGGGQGGQGSFGGQGGHPGSSGGGGGNPNGSGSPNINSMSGQGGPGGASSQMVSAVPCPLSVVSRLCCFAISHGWWFSLQLWIDSICFSRNDVSSAAPLWSFFWWVRVNPECKIYHCFVASQNALRRGENGTAIWIFYSLYHCMGSLTPYLRGFYGPTA